MKYLRFFPALILFLFFASCIGEDMSDCPTDDSNLVLYFNYTGGEGEEAFPSKITKVDLMLFSEDGYYLQRFTVEEEELADFQGIRMHLDPGRYYLIHWGNFYGRSRFSLMDSTTTIHSAKVYIDSELTADSLYYAPKKTNTNADLDLYEIVVPEEGKVEKNIAFMSAYYTVNVFVKGLEDPVKGINQAPVIRMSSVPQGYNFHLEPGDDNSKLRRSSTFDISDGYEVARASFHTPHFEVENAIEIDIIKSTTGTTEYTVNLQEVLVANRYVLTMGKHVNIDVFVEFQENGEVEVTLSFPSWEDNPIEPF